MTEKEELIQTVAKLEAEIPSLEDKRRTLEEQAKGSNTQYMIGLIGLLLGIVLLFPLAPLGILLILAGGLAAGTQYVKRSNARKAVDELTTTIEAKRADLAQAKAQLAAL